MAFAPMRRQLLKPEQPILTADDPFETTGPVRQPMAPPPPAPAPTFNPLPVEPPQMHFNAQTSDNNTPPPGGTSTIPPTAAPGALPPNDAWGNPTGSQQSQIDTFWNEVTAGGRMAFSPDELNAWGIKQISSDKYLLPNGQTVDIIEDEGPGGKNKPSWTISGGQPGQNGQGVNTGGGGGGGGGGAPGGAGGPGGVSGPGDLNSIIDDAIAKMAGSGETSFGHDIGQTLMSIIRGGKAPDISKRLVQAREAEAAGMRSQVNDARGILADRGIISEPGEPQGEEINTIGRLTENLAVPYGQAIGDIEQHGMDLQAQAEQQALELATGMSSDQAHNILGAVGQGTQRQTALASIALQQLQSDRGWQQFLSEFGLKHDQVMEQLRQGRVNQVIALAQAYDRQASGAGEGYY